jgi:DNA adenine methylase
MALLRRGAVSRVFLVERDPLLYSFWQQLKISPDALIRRLKRQKVDLASWAKMQRYLRVSRPDPSMTLELATACVFLNRTNFSGILHAKPIGGIGQKSKYAIDCRFNKEGVAQALLATAELVPKVNIAFGDGVAYLLRNRNRIASKDRVVYVDPPYYGQGRKLYRFHYRDKDHARLARVLNESPFRWVASYDNHQYVRGLFSGQTIVPIFLNYVVKQSRRAEELLISNVRLPPVHYHGEPDAEEGVMAIV